MLRIIGMLLIVVCGLPSVEATAAAGADQDPAPPDECLDGVELGRNCRARKQVGDLEVSNVACRRATGEHCPQLGDDPEMGAVVEASVQHLARHPLTTLGDDHLVDLELVDEFGEIVDRAQDGETHQPA